MKTRVFSIYSYLGFGGRAEALSGRLRRAQTLMRALGIAMIVVAAA